MAALTDAEAVRLYRSFSEDTHAAGWSGRPEQTPALLEEFREWLRGRLGEPEPELTDYEKAAVPALQDAIVKAWSGAR